MSTLQPRAMSSKSNFIGAFQQSMMKVSELSRNISKQIPPGESVKVQPVDNSDNVTNLAESAELDKNSKTQGSEQEYMVEKLLDKLEKYRSTLMQASNGEIDRSGTIKLPDGYTRVVNKDGSYFIKNRENKIVKTFDKLRVLREFRYVNELLQIKKFGVFVDSPNAQILEDGTVVHKTEESEIREYLDGRHVHICSKKGVLIDSNRQTGEEIVIVSTKGEIHHRQCLANMDRYRIIVDDQVVLAYDSYQKPKPILIRTPSGSQVLDWVIRIEQKFANGELVQETYQFHNQENGQRALKLDLELPNGNLHLAWVHKVSSKYERGNVVDTIYSLQEPVTVSKDSNNGPSLIKGIKHVRSFQLRQGVYAIAFIDAQGDENLHFPELQLPEI